MVNIRVHFISNLKDKEPKIYTRLYYFENIFYSFLKDKPKAIIKNNKLYKLRDEVFNIDDQALVLFYHNEEI